MALTTTFGRSPLAQNQFSGEFLEKLQKTSLILEFLAWHLKNWNIPQKFGYSSYIIKYKKFQKVQNDGKNFTIFR